MGWKLYICFNKFFERKPQERCSFLYPQIWRCQFKHISLFFKMVKETFRQMLYDIS